MPKNLNKSRKQSNKLNKDYYKIYCFYNSYKNLFIINTLGNRKYYYFKSPLLSKHKIRHYYSSSYDLKNRNNALLD